MCSKPKAPKAPNAPPPPAEAAVAPPMSSQAGNARMADERRRRQATGGVGLGTVLTSTRGVTDRPPSGEYYTPETEITRKHFVTAGKKSKKGLLGAVFRSISSNRNNVGDTGTRVTGGGDTGKQARFKTVLGG